MAKKLNRFMVCVILILAACIICFGTVSVYAAEPEEPANDTEIAQTEEETAEQETTETTEQLAAQFVEWLKAEYGEDYEYYYNIIINKWGSIENYLIQFGNNNLTEEQNTVWKSIVQGFSETASFWAPPLAVIIVVIVCMWGKSKFKKIIDAVVEGKFRQLKDAQTAQTEELNKQSAAIIAIADGQKALMGGAEKFAENREQLDNAAKELANG